MKAYVPWLESNAFLQGLSWTTVLSVLVILYCPFKVGFWSYILINNPEVCLKDIEIYGIPRWTLPVLRVFSLWGILDLNLEPLQPHAAITEQPHTVEYFIFLTVLQEDLKMHSGKGGQENVI